MKANLRRTNAPKILAANLSSEHSDKLLELAKKHRAELIVCDDLQKSPAELLGEKTAVSKDMGGYPDSDSECLLFAGFEKGALNPLLDDLKRENISIPLKALYTPHNRCWTFARLINDLTEEHKRMTGGAAK